MIRHSARLGARTGARPALMTMWALVVLAFLGMLLGLTATQLLGSRRTLDHRQNELQALWLARSGLELAATRLLTNPAGYKGESVELLPDSQVRIEVTAQPNDPNVFAVTSEARFPLEGRDRIKLSRTCWYRRVTDKEKVRLEVLPEVKPLPENAPPAPKKPAEKIGKPQD
jgi:type II secretory pathway pseudopilin PulG